MPTTGSAVASIENLEERIYEASVLPEFWRPVLRDFARYAESSEAIVVATDGVNSRFVTSSDHFAEMAQKHYAYPTGRERTRRLLARRHAGFLGDVDVFEVAELESDLLFNEFLIPNGYGRGIATAIEVTGGDTIIFHAEGPFSTAPFASRLVRRLDALRPHLARSALVSSRLAFEGVRTAVETLAALGFAACAVKARGSVIVANEEFDRESHYWTTRGSSRIALADKRADQLLQEAIGAVAGGRTVSSIALGASERHPAAVLHVIPVRRAAHDLFVNSAAILVLTRSKTAPTAATPLLQALFDFSPTEASLAARIAAGQTVERIALEEGKSVHTVRNQLKSVLAKTGCTRQVDLARLLAQLVPG